MYMQNSIGQHYRYFPATNTWTLLTARPVSGQRNSGICCTDVGNLVIAGGYTGTNRLDSYNPNSSTWTQIGTLPVTTWNTTLIYAGDNVYYWLYAPSGAGTGTNFVRYNGSTFTTLAAPGIGGTSNGYFYNGKAYTNANTPRRLRQYDVSSNTWSDAYIVGPNTTANPVIAGYNNFIYIWSNNTGLYVYDISTDTGSLITSNVGSKICVGMNFYNNNLYAMFTDNTVSIVA